MKGNTRRVSTFTLYVGVILALPDDREWTVASILPDGVKLVIPGGETFALRVRIDDTNQTIDSVEAARIMGLSVKHIHNLATRGKIPFERQGRYMLFQRSVIQELANSRPAVIDSRPLNRKERGFPRGSRFSDADDESILQRRANRESLRTIAADYNVSHETMRLHIISLQQSDKP